MEKWPAWRRSTFSKCFSSIYIVTSYIVHPGITCVVQMSLDNTQPSKWWCMFQCQWQLSCWLLLVCDNWDLLSINLMNVIVRQKCIYKYYTHQHQTAYENVILSHTKDTAVYISILLLFLAYLCKMLMEYFMSWCFYISTDISQYIMCLQKLVTVERKRTDYRQQTPLSCINSCTYSITHKVHTLCLSEEE